MDTGLSAIRGSSFKSLLDSKLTIESINYIHELLSSLSYVICIFNADRQLISKFDDRSQCRRW
jgi:hypothetical protein